MALTPEDVVTKEFQHVRFKDGFDPDEVDDFLDEVVVEWRKTVEENVALKVKLEQAEASLAAAPVAAAQTVDAEAVVDAPSNSASIIALAQRLHDEHVAEGEAKLKELVASGEEQHSKLVADAESEAKRILTDANTAQHQEAVRLEAQKTKLEAAIKELREYEATYRGQLRSLIEKHLKDLATDSPAE